MNTVSKNTNATIVTFAITQDMSPFDYLGKEQMFDLVDKKYEYNTRYSDFKKEKDSINTITKILNLLEVDKIWVTESGSLMDCHLKVDVVVKYNNRYIGFQVKSSQFGFTKYVEQWKGKKLKPFGYYSVEKKMYNAPGCVWCNSNSKPIELMLAISKWLNIPIKDEVKDTLIKYKQLRKLNVFSISNDIAQLMNLTIEEINTWVTLKIATFKDGKITYLNYK
ncbi:hypothetical protein [Scytonema sp. NUACC26]|uniref:hypothetical protein n=1 Tax=Scytonema sp. NUACC26 TaxID=3140176 RepID=UPI0034DC1B75